MSSPPPTKPPRGVKQGRETSGLLMSVIRTLSASETNEQREKERAKLEKEYKKSDARLDELVAEHAQEIMEVMQKFSSVQAALASWGQHTDAATARLTACRSLLRVRRDELRRLWQDARTHHHALHMLTIIERVVVSERDIRDHLSRGLVLACAHSLRSALDTAATTLSHVSALNTTRAHLEEKKHELVTVILRRLSSALYGEAAPLTRRMSSRRRTALLLAELTKSEEVTDAYLQDITPEFEASLTEEDKTFETTVMISLEALGVLNQLKEATEKFKVQIQDELLTVIESVSRRIIEDGDVETDVPDVLEVPDAPDVPDEVVENSKPLRLVNALVEQFRTCATRNKRLLQLWRAALQKHKISDSCLHTEIHYWSAVQQVLQLLLTDYLQIESVTLAAARSTSASDTQSELRIADYFAKKRPQRREKLFKLNVGVVPAVSAAARRYPLVCRPDPGLLHVLLPTLHKLTHDIEPVVGGECSLRAFITDYVRSGESERLASEARASIEVAMKAAAWRERAPPEPPSANHRLVFSCCTAGWAAVAHCAHAARRCGACGATHALRALPAALAALAAHARAAHLRLQPAQPARAAKWLADDDIVRFLQTLPNWQAVVDPNSAGKNEQDLKQAYEREAEILGSSLGDGAVSRREIVGDINALGDLALLCESMDWLATNIRSLPGLLTAPSGGVRLTDKLREDISAAAAIFDEISHKCLLFLHLEMRIQCFHYLGQPAGGDDDEAGGAGRLAHALLAFHEHATNVMAAGRRAYIFNGIGEMMSAGVVWRWQCMEAELAGGTLATLRHCLAALSLPHAGLQRAHDYSRLLLAMPEPEEIIASIREKGAQFTELEYLNAFKVIAARRGLSQADMKPHLKALASALGHVGVTV
ncbi:exocyst complex component 4 [Cydia pomonella]|uniref:exocyst complex component 4 n=1 Tax=Cydia pomonella TaxID=82600 RepID=UPI002ADE1BA6|nr:exocyst complex component 4 [Cydia pomonella]